VLNVWEIKIYEIHHAWAGCEAHYFNETYK